MNGMVRLSKIMLGLHIFKQTLTLQAIMEKYVHKIKTCLSLCKHLCFSWPIAKLYFDFRCKANLFLTDTYYIGPIQTMGDDHVWGRETF